MCFGLAQFGQHDRVEQDHEKSISRGKSCTEAHGRSLKLFLIQAATILKLGAKDRSDTLAQASTVPHESGSSVVRNRHASAKQIAVAIHVIHPAHRWPVFDLLQA